MFYFIKSETSDSFVNNFDGHFAYLKTLDFYFKDCNILFIHMQLYETKSLSQLLVF